MAFGTGIRASGYRGCIQLHAGGILAVMHGMAVVTPAGYLCLRAPTEKKKEESCKEDDPPFPAG